MSNEPKSTNATTKTINNLTFYAAGSVSGIMEVLTTHPIDVIKTKIQQMASQNKTFNIKNITGVKYLYSGFQYRLIGIVPMRGIYWGTLDMSSRLLINTIPNKNKRLIIAGIIAGTAQTVVDAPIEYMKTQQITSSNVLKFSNLFSNLKFRGFGPTLMRNSKFAGIFNVTANTNYLPVDNTIVKYGFAGLTASLLTQPYDYYKTLVQTYPNTSISKIRIEVYSAVQKNIFVLWKGGLSRSILGCCTMGIGGFVYKTIINLS